MAAIERIEIMHGRPAAQGGAHRRDPGLRQPGDADRPHHRRRRRGRAPATATRSAPAARRSCALLARPPGAAADRPRRRARSRRSGRTSSSRPTPRRSARSPRWRSPRSTPRSGTCAAARAGLPLHVDGRRRAGRGAALHDRGRLAAASSRRSWSSEALARQGARASAARRSRSASRTSREDVARLAAVREAVGDATSRSWSTPTRRSPSTRRSAARGLFEPLDLAWFEEPLPAEDLGGHVRLAAARRMPIAVGESIYQPAALPRIPAARAPARSSRSTSRASAASRRGSRSRIWPRPSTSPICPHFLMELHVSPARGGAERPLGRVHPAARRPHDSSGMRDRGRPRGPARGAGPRHRMGHGRDRGPARPRADAACRLSRIPGFRPPGAPS